nr:hypothetical protein Iba_chr01aCG15910 [Ipomoea batatas]
MKKMNVAYVSLFAACELVNCNAINRKLPKDLRNGDNVLNRRLAFPKGNAIQCRCSSGAVSKGGESKSCSATTSASVHREPPARLLYDPQQSICLQQTLQWRCFTF